MLVPDQSKHMNHFSQQLLFGVVLDYSQDCHHEHLLQCHVLKQILNQLVSLMACSPKSIFGIRTEHLKSTKLKI